MHVLNTRRLLIFVVENNTSNKKDINNINLSVCPNVTMHPLKTDLKWNPDLWSCRFLKPPDNSFLLDLLRCYFASDVLTPSLFFGTKFHFN